MLNADVSEFVSRWNAGGVIRDVRDLRAFALRFSRERGCDVSFLGAGVSRAAFLFGGDLVVKFDFFPQLGINAREWNVWLNADVRQRSVLAECFAFVGGALVQEYCGEVVGSLDSSSVRSAFRSRVVRKVRRIFSGQKIVPYDLSAANISLSGKVVDYAGFSY